MNGLLMWVKITVVSMLLWATPAVSAEISATMLLKEKQECKQECSLTGNNEIVCETLCSCTVDQFSKLSLAEFQSMKSQLDAENVSATLQTYLAGVGTKCVAELDRIVNGLSKPPQIP